MSAAPAPAPPRRLRFDGFEVDVRAGELLREDRRIRLAPKPFAVLLALAERPGQVVLREELRARLWPDNTFVDFDNNLNSAVATLRETLGDTAAAPRYLETIPKRGYRFLPPVEVVTENAAAAGAQAPAATPRRPRRALPTAAAALGLAALSTGLWAVLVKPHPVPTPAPAAAPAPAGELRLAVLPSAAASGAEADEAFAAGLGEELRVALSRRLPEGTAVIAADSARRAAASGEGAEAVAARLGVRHLVRGAVHRDGAARLRITAELVRGADGATVWAEQLDRTPETVWTSQEAIARQVAAALALRLEPAPARPELSGEAAAAYLRGRWLLAAPRRDAAAALPELERAAALAPDHAPVQLALAQALRRRPLPPRATVPAARAALDRALALEPGLAEAHLEAAEIALYFDFDGDRAARELARAGAGGGRSSPVEQAHAAYLASRGRFAEAEAAMERARAIDPISVSVAADAGWYAYVARRPERAIERTAEALRLAPGDAGAHFYRLLAFQALGDLDAAAAAAAANARAQGADEGLAATFAEGAGGLRRYARWRYERRLEQARREYVSPSLFALDHLAMGGPGAHEPAIAALEAAWRDRSGWLLAFLRVYPALDPLRGDPRFQALERRLGQR